MQYGQDRIVSRYWGCLAGSLSFLLCVGLLGSDSGFVASLRGSSDQTEVARSPALGYYEALLAGPQVEIGANPAQPPPGWLPFGDEQTGIVNEVPAYIRWKLRPDLDTSWYRKAFRTNSHGYRTPEVALQKPPATYRIVVFGSSNTMGYGVQEEETYVRHLERWLNECTGPDMRIEVVNLAVSGDSPSRRLARLQEEAARFDPDWVLCDASPFDAWVEEAHIHASLQRNLPIPFAFVKEAIERSGVSAIDSIDAFRAKFQGEAERMYSHVYAGWSAEARRLGVPLTVLLLPRSDSKDKSGRVIQLIRSVSHTHGLDYLDLSSAFDELDQDEFYISDWDKHPNARGHRAIFDELRDALLSRGSLPRRGWSNQVATLRDG
jgi:lysophospholipase L1-like esterase